MRRSSEQVGGGVRASGGVSCVDLALLLCLRAGRCEPKGALTGSNAGITSIDFDSAVSRRHWSSMSDMLCVVVTCRVVCL